MSALAPPPSAREPSVKREFSAPPDVFEKSAANALPGTDPEDQALIEAINQELSKDDAINGQSLDSADIEMQTASANHQGAANQEVYGSLQHQGHGTFTPPASAQRTSTIFPGIEDVSDDADAEELSDDGSDGLFIPRSPVTPSKKDEFADQTRYSNKQRKSSGPRAKTAREWHKNSTKKLESHQKRGPAFKRQQLLNLLKIGDRKRKSNKPSPRDLSDAAPTAVPKEAKGSNKTQYWKHFVEQNHGIDMHRSKTDWNQLVKKSTSFGYSKMSRIDDRWQLVGMILVS
jgi:hypothetical protein